MSTFIILPARRIGVARDAVAAGKAGRAELLRNRRQTNVELLRATLNDPIQANEAFSVTGDQTDVPLMGSGGVAADVPLSLDALGAIILQNPDTLELDKLRATGATVIENVTVYGGQPDAKTADTRDIPADGDLWHLERIGARSLHDEGIDGEGVLVGVIDTGVDAHHPDLAGRIAHYAAFDPGGRFMASLRKDYGDHGTHVCGTIAGKVCGVAPGAKLAVAAALTTIDANGQSTGTLAQVLAAANWLIQTDFGEQNVTILNMSLGIRGYDDFAYDVVSKRSVRSGHPRGRCYRQQRTGRRGRTRQPRQLRHRPWSGSDRSERRRRGVLGPRLGRTAFRPSQARPVCARRGDNQRGARRGLQSDGWDIHGGSSRIGGLCTPSSAGSLASRERQAAWKRRS